MSVEWVRLRVPSKSLHTDSDVVLLELLCEVNKLLGLCLRQPTSAALTSSEPYLHRASDEGNDALVLILVLTVLKNEL